MTSVCPAETGNASATASARAFFSRMRAAGKQQNGQSLGLKSPIIDLDVPAAQAPDLLVIIAPELTPQPRVKADVGQVAVITEELPALELLKGHAQHQPLGARLVQLVHRHLPRPRPLHDQPGRLPV